jgi:hypothetical protein
MNTGIQDSYNLAWKLALVLRGKADGKILETYNEERLENAKNLLQTTDRMFQVAAGSEWFLSFVRMNVLPSIAKYLLALDPVKNFIFPLISQIGINYRHGSLSEHAGDEDFDVKAGDRMPYLQVDGESIYNKLHQPKFHWLHFSDARQDFQPIKAEIERQYGGLVDVNFSSLDPRIEEIFGSDKAFNLLLRPDNYIGFISEGDSATALESYLNKIASSNS